VLHGGADFVEVYAEHSHNSSIGYADRKIETLSDTVISGVGIRGFVGTLLCCLGGSLGWAVYLLVQHLGGGAAVSSLFASMVVAIYANIMSRVRKCPVTPYLVVSYFPLVPGFTLYQAMSYGIGGNIQQFLETFILTFSIGGCIALGTLMVSTAIRAFQSRKGNRHASL